MVNLRTPYYDDSRFDDCGNETVAVLETKDNSIPLCEECLDKLMDDIHEIMEVLGRE